MMPSRPLCLASACLCGIACRYDGTAAGAPPLPALFARGLVLAVCPEMDGGLPAPRPPCELRDGRAVTRDGTDLTAPFAAGAAHALDLARRHGIRLAVLKENSPSCGSSRVHDGGFTGRRIPGMGITAALLARNGVRVISENDLDAGFADRLGNLSEEPSQDAAASLVQDAEPSLAKNAAAFLAKDAESSPARVRLLLTVDVEEAGLFRGRYERDGRPVGNAACLRLLGPLLERFNLPITLLCTHRTFDDPAACRALDAFCSKHKVEIGAHLHHWNTPPFSPAREGADSYADPYAAPCANHPTDPRETLERKLAALFKAGRLYAGRPPTSFRMGRWHLRRALWPLLAEAGVLVDASVRPLHFAPNGPDGAGGADHFHAPARPYSFQVNGRTMIEAPLTCLPLYPSLPAHLRRLEEAAGGGGFARFAQRLKTFAPWLPALALTPAYQPLWALRGIAGTHLARGGDTLTLAWHSSELMPGGAPHMPDAGAVEAFVRKLEHFLTWLHAKTEVAGLTLSDLARPPDGPPAPAFEPAGDWSWTDD